MKSRIEWPSVHVHMVLYRTVHLYNFYQGRAFYISISMLQSANWKKLTTSSQSAHAVSLGQAIYCKSEIFFVTYCNFQWIKSQREASAQPLTSMSEYLSFTAKYLSFTAKFTLRNVHQDLIKSNSNHNNWISGYQMQLIDSDFAEALWRIQCWLKYISSHI